MGGVPMSLPAEREIINTYDQLRRAGGGIAIIAQHGGIRETYVDGWLILRLDAKGQKLITDKDAAWYHNGLRWIHADRAKYSNWHDRQRAALELAQEWVAGAYGEQGPWKRNRMGDYLPERIAVQFPLRKKPRRSKTDQKESR